MRPALILLAVVALVATAVAGLRWWQTRAYWPEWEAYASHFIQDDGRVVDRTAGDRTTSEGQAYSLFFALVAKDRPRFDRILQWTRANLCAGECANRLPAWHWGQREDKSWGVIDDNPATDADLWMAYVLLQAARIWKDESLAVSGRQILALIKTQELVTAGDAGLLLLPAPKGFALEGERWRLNPSYYPRFQFEGLATADPSGPWRRIWKNFEALLPQAASSGLVPDWFIVDAAGRVSADIDKPNLGSYDAIRVYLWAGMSEGADGAGGRRYAAFATQIDRLGFPPEILDVSSGVASGGHPIGFSGAVLPWLKGLDEHDALESQQRVLQNAGIAHLLGQPPHYYDQVLALFGEGWISGRFRFGTDGRVTLKWER